MSLENNSQTIRLDKSGGKLVRLGLIALAIFLGIIVVLVVGSQYFLPQQPGLVEQEVVLDDPFPFSESESRHRKLAREAGLILTDAGVRVSAITVDDNLERLPDGLLKYVCAEGGYDIEPYAGTQVRQFVYEMSERYEGELLHLHVWDADQDVVCMFKAVGEDSALAPGVFPMEKKSVVTGEIIAGLLNDGTPAVIEVPDELRSCSSNADCVSLSTNCGCGLAGVNRSYVDSLSPVVTRQADACAALDMTEKPQCSFIGQLHCAQPAGVCEFTLDEIDDEPAILFEYTFGVQGMVEHIGLDYAGNWYYENNLPFENNGVLQHGDTGTLTPDDLLLMQERIQESGIVDMKLLQKSDEGLLCDGSTSYGLMVDGEQYDFRSPCVGEDTENTKKIFLELGGLADYLKSLCEKRFVDE